MQYYTPPCQCQNCNAPIHANVLRQSVNYVGYALCLPCQQQLKDKFRDSSRETMKLYFSLKRRGVPAAFEGVEAIDIAVVDTVVNIEVEQHVTHYNPGSALAQLQDAFFAANNGLTRIRIPSALIAYNLEETADRITGFLNANARKRSYLSN